MRDHRREWWLLIPTLLFVLAVGLDLTPLLRGPDEWRWTLRPYELSTRWLVPVLALALYTLVCARWLSSFKPSAGERRFLLFLTLAAPLIQFALAASLRRYPLFEFFAPTVSVHTSGYFNTAVATSDLNHMLANYPSIMPGLPIHAQSHPPGPIVMHWLAWRIFEALPGLAEAVGLPLRTLQCHNAALMTLDTAQIASALVGMLTPALGALAVWPLYAFGRRVVGEKTAASAAALFPILPLFAMWPAQWDQVYPLLLLSSLYFAHTGLEMRSTWRLFVAGVPLSIATFFSVGNFALIAIVGLYGAAWVVVNHHGTKSPRTLAVMTPRWLIAFALGSASVWLVYALAYQVNPLDVISTGARLAFESTTGARTYGVWLVWNPVEFAMFLGVPLTLILSRLRRPARTPAPLTVAALGALLALNVSGSVRGEVGRLWLYFGPLLALMALPRAEPPGRAFHAILIGLTALQLLAMNTRWLVSDSFLDEPPERQASFTAPHPMTAASLGFGRQIELAGYDASEASGTLDLTLYWRALVQPPHAYTVFVHVIDSGGRQVGQKDNMPVRDQLPT